MSAKVLILGSFDKKKLSCSIPRFQQTTGRYQLQIRHDNNPIILQTPKVFISKKLKSLALMLPAQSWSPFVRLFYNVMRSIDSFIQEGVGCKGDIYKYWFQY